MLRRLLSVMLAATVLSQGIARADEPAVPRVTAMCGEVVDTDAGSAVIDQLAVEDRSEPTARPQREAQALQNRTKSTPRREKVGKIIEIAALVGVALAFLLNWASHLKWQPR